MKVETAHLNGNGSGLEVVDLSDESVYSKRRFLQLPAKAESLICKSP